MKKVFSLLSALIVLTLASCANDDSLMLSSEVGYVSLQINTQTSTHTRALDQKNYNAKQIAVVITNEAGEVVESTDDYTIWQDKDLTLPVGTYTITAASNGFDGQESGFGIPYYRGTGMVVVEKKTRKAVEITCKLATVKVTVNFTDRFKAAFQSANVRVSSAIAGVAPLDYVMSANYDPSVAGYFPVGNLVAKLSVTSSKGTFSQEKALDDVRARDHFILTYDVAESGKTQISVSADDNGKVYTYNIDVSSFDRTIINVADLSQDPSALWATTATLGATVDGVEEFDVAQAVFEYKAEGSADYISVPAVEQASEGSAHALKAELKGLTPNTHYVYRLAYGSGDDRFYSVERAFVTEAAAQLYNSNMDLWYKRPGSGFSRRDQWFACSEDYFKDNGTWWDSSNRGTTEGAGALANKNPTTGVTSPVHTPGGMAAQLASTAAVGVFAAASLYAGSFNSLNGLSGAKLDWGRVFTSRPKTLRFWYQYTSKAMDYVGSNAPKEANLVKGTTLDMCSAYIALIHVDKPNANGTAITVDNTDMTTFPDWTTDPRVVAYAQMPAADCVSTNGQWKEMNLNLEYHRTDVRPTHVVVVFAASKYGDYFTGSTGSVLLLDDLELVY